MALTWKDRIKVASATTGTGTLTLGAAASGYRTFAAGDDGKLFAYVIEDGTAWETGYGTYTHSGTTFARTTRTDSSTGSAISCSGSESLYVDYIATDATSNTRKQQAHIEGLLVTKHTAANTLDISAGTCYDPSSSKIISYAGGSGVSAGSLGVSQWNQVYIYDSAGTATIEVVNNADPPSTTYAGTARMGGTNSNRRWIGAFLTNASSNLFAATVLEVGNGAIKVSYTEDVGSAPFRVLSAGTSGSFTTVALSGCLPKYVCPEMFVRTIGVNTNTSTFTVLDTSLEGTYSSGRLYFSIVVAGGSPQISIWFPIDQANTQIYYSTTASGGGTPSVYMDVNGYRAVR